MVDYLFAAASAWKYTVPICALIVAAMVNIQNSMRTRFINNLERVTPKPLGPFRISLFCTYLVPIVFAWYWYRPTTPNPLTSVNYPDAIARMVFGFALPFFLTYRILIQFHLRKRSRLGEVDFTKKEANHIVRGRDLVVLFILLAALGPSNLVPNRNYEQSTWWTILLILIVYVFVVGFRDLKSIKFKPIDYKEDSIEETPVFAQMNKAISWFSKKKPRWKLLMRKNPNTSHRSLRQQSSAQLQFWQPSLGVAQPTLPIEMLSNVSPQAVVLAAILRWSRFLPLKTAPWIRRNFMLIFVILILGSLLLGPIIMTFGIFSGLANPQSRSLARLIVFLGLMVLLLSFALIVLYIVSSLLKMIIIRPKEYRISYQVWSDSLPSYEKSTPVDFMRVYAVLLLTVEYGLTEKGLIQKLCSNTPMMKWLLEYGPELKEEALGVAKEEFARRDYYMTN